jgi:hypothetical protein
LGPLELSNPEKHLDGHDIEAGSHEESVRIVTSDLVRLADADLADICAD